MSYTPAAPGSYRTSAERAPYLRLADGSSIRMDVTTGDIEFMDEIVGGTIVYGAANAEPLLGVTAMESAGVEVDPHNQTLNKLPEVRLRGFRL